MTRAVYPVPPYERTPDEFDQVPVDENTLPLPETVEATREYVRRMFGRELASMAACYALVFGVAPLLLTYAPELVALARAVS